MAGGGGGDGGYSSRQAEIETGKQRARDALNRVFGVRTAPRQEDFQRQEIHADRGDIFYVPDTEAFARAQQEFQASPGGSRDALYSKVRANAFSAGKRSLDEAQTKAARDLKFELFARGLAGGSEDIEQNATLKRTYNKGLMDLGAKADQAAADYRSDDENTRLQLLQSIDGGMDQGSALSSAMNQLKVNSDRAAAAAQGTTLGDLFADAGLLYTESQAAKGRQQGGQDWWNTYTASNRSGRPSRSANGTITPT